LRIEAAKGKPVLVDIKDPARTSAGNHEEIDLAQSLTFSSLTEENWWQVVLDAQVIHENPPEYWQGQGGAACWFVLGRLFVHREGTGTGKFLSQGHWVVAVVEQKGLQQRIGRESHFGEKYRQTLAVPPNDLAGKAKEKLPFRSAFLNGQGAGGGRLGRVRYNQKYPCQAEIPALTEGVVGAAKADPDHVLQGDSPVAASVDHGVFSSFGGVLVRGLVEFFSMLRELLAKGGPKKHFTFFRRVDGEMR
jgi:hypothetical protein